MSKTYLWLHNIEKDFYKLVQLLRETFTTTPAQHVTTSDLQVLWGLKHGMDGWLGLCKVRTGWRRMADRKMRMEKCGWKNADEKMRMEKRGW